MVNTKKSIIKLSILLIMGIGAIYFGYNWYLRNTPEAKIHHFLKELSYYASRPAKDKLPTMIMKNQGFGELFAPQSRLEFRAEMLNGNYTPTSLTSWISRTRMYFTSLDVTIKDVKINLISDTEAVVYFTGRAVGYTQSGYDVDEVRDIESKLEYIDGDWKIKSMVSRQVMEK